MNAAPSRKSHRTCRPLFKANAADENSVKRKRWIPSANASETRDAYIITLDVPGMDRTNFKIHCTDRKLTVKGAKERLIQPMGKTDLEYDYTEWQRSFLLPEDADIHLAHADYVCGELVIIIPRSEKVIQSGECDVFVY